MNELDTLLAPLEERMSLNSGLNYFIKYLSTLEGFKTKIKNLHWAAFAMNIHVRLDELLEIVSDFQDSIAEEAMGIYGQMGPSVIAGVPCDCSDPLTVLDGLKMKTLDFYRGLGDKMEHAGLRSETETFIHNLNKYTYLFRLCKG